MKTVVVISDSHGDRAAIAKIKNLVAENDYVIHCGDGAADMLELYREYPEKVYVCMGNCDLYGRRIAMDEWEIPIENHKIFCCHGHKYRVKSTLREIANEAIKRDCDIVLYGHTHVADIREEKGVTLINPGALHSYVNPSYAYLAVNKDKFVSTIVTLQI